MTLDDHRVQIMFNWLQSDLTLKIRQFGTASSDASFRRYFRINTSEQTYVVMDAPPDKENIAPFIKVCKLLKQAGVNVPTIYHQNLEHGFLLLEDFGSSSFLAVVNDNNSDDLYQLACNSLFKQQNQAPSSNLPSYDRPLLERELAIFDEWFLDKYLGILMPAAIKSTLSKLLVDSALEQPVCFVHRDFHSRNLMIVDQHTIGILDFQDAVLGPITYDLASLFRDCYISWPQAKIDSWLNTYFERLIQTDLIDCSLDQFRRWFDLMGLQRHLKAIGIFSRLNLRDGKPGYLLDIPRTLTYVSTISNQYRELSVFSDFLNNQIFPAYNQLR